MARPDKAASVAELTEEFRSSGAAVLTEYRGLTVSELTELRRALGKDVTYTVVKNTLTKLAVKGSDLADGEAATLDALLQGPTAIAFVKGDAVDAAKGLRDFAKAHPLLVIKGGVLDNKTLTPDEIRKLADLESREVLLAKLAGAMKGSLSQAVSLFAAPLAQAARVIAALQDMKAAEPQPAPEVAAEPVAAEPVADQPVEPPTDAATGDDNTTTESANDSGPTPEEASAPTAESGDAVAAQAADGLEEASAEPLAEATPAADGPADSAPDVDTATATDETSPATPES
jgi:large subunit ribosomal protein L10